MSATKEEKEDDDDDDEIIWSENQAADESTRNKDGAYSGLRNLFADPNPIETFRFEYRLPHYQDDDNDNERTTTGSVRVLKITLSGQKAELGQVLSSTGLTLWRASELLADYLIQQQQQQQQGDVVAHLELGGEKKIKTTFDKQSQHQRQNHQVRGNRVLELGAGLGLCGILAHLLGAADVVLTDGDTDTLANLRKNVRANCGDAAVQGSNSGNNKVQVKQLVWGQNISTFGEEFGQFDFILGADIIYIPDAVEPLLTTVDRLLQLNGFFFLAHARRNVPINVVLETAARHGLVWKSPANAEGVYVFSREKRTGKKV